MPIAVWLVRTDYRGLDWHLGVKQHGPTLGFSSLDRPWGKASRVGEPGLTRDRITTRSPGNGGGVVGGTMPKANADRDPGVTPVQRQGYPSAPNRRRIGTVEQAVVVAILVKADFDPRR